MDKSPLTVWGELKKSLLGLWSLVVGLAVTGNQFFRHTVTVHYPRQTVDNLATFRGPLELVPSSGDPGRPHCIVCGICAQNCPSNCIEIKSHIEELAEAEDPKGPPAGGEGEGEKKAPAKKKRKIKVIDSFTQVFHLCSLCGLCVQNCPGEGLRFSQDVYLAGFSRSDFELDLLARMRARAKPGATGIDGKE